MSLLLFFCYFTNIICILLLYYLSYLIVLLLLLLLLLFLRGAFGRTDLFASERRKRSSRIFMYMNTHTAYLAILRLLMNASRCFFDFLELWDVSVCHRNIMLVSLCIYVCVHMRSYINILQYVCVYIYIYI